MKKIKTILLFFFIAGIMTGCSFLNKQNADRSISDPGKEDTPVTYENEVKKVRKDNLKTVEDMVEVDHISYKINKMTVSQELGDHKKEDVNYLTDETDAQGNLLGNNRFIWLELTIKNESDTEQTVIVNSNLFYGISEDQVIVEADAEAVYIKPQEKNRPLNESFYCELQPGGERELEVGYVIDRETVKGTLYYGIGSSGSDIDQIDNKFINVEEYWDEK